MNEIVGNDVKVKVIREIRSWIAYKAMIVVGAMKIITNSSFVILKQLEKEEVKVHWKCFFDTARNLGID